MGGIVWMGREERMDGKKSKKEGGSLKARMWLLWEGVRSRVKWERGLESVGIQIELCVREKEKCDPECVFGSADHVQQRETGERESLR